jgi:serine/threonine protein kinase
MNAAGVSSIKVGPEMGDVPAEKMVGVTLPNGWVVVERLIKQPHSSGGNFSRCYIVEKDKRRAFLKALDFSVAAGLPNELDVIQRMLDAYQFERNLLAQCAERRMDRVVVAVEDGSVKVDNTPVIGTVHYLIFEPADGDVRKHLHVAQNVTTAWILRCLHHIATGLWQLHRANIAHQDAKPSNVLVFAGTTSKIADLGSASLRGTLSPRDDKRYAGDGTYAPPELLYGRPDGEWVRRRQACDIYLLGSMIVFFFTTVGVTALTMHNLPRSQRPTANPWRGGWTGPYEAILPEVRHAFDKALREFGNLVPGENLRTKLVTMVSQLCDPDPLLRGHPKNRVGVSNPYSLERYVADLDLLARRAEIGLLEHKQCF